MIPLDLIINRLGKPITELPIHSSIFHHRGWFGERVKGTIARSIKQPPVHHVTRLPLSSTPSFTSSLSRGVFPNNSIKLVQLNYEKNSLPSNLSVFYYSESNTLTFTIVTKPRSLQWNNCAFLQYNVRKCWCPHRYSFFFFFGVIFMNNDI